MAESRAADARTAGVIYDLGYERYEGARLGRANAIRTLAGFSFLTAFGVGRGGRAKIVPWAVTALVYLPAVIQAGIAVMGGRSFINYARYLEQVTFFFAVFTAAQAAELAVADRQYRVLSLYLARPLHATDYALARLAGFFAALLALTLGPELVLFAGKVFVSPTPWRAFVTDWKTLGPIVGGMTLAALYLAAAGLALASLAARRAYGSAAVMAFFMLLPAASGIARGIVTGDARRYTVLANPFAVITGYANWLFDVQARRRSLVAQAALPGTAYLYVILATCAVAVAVFVLRYRKGDA